MLKVYPKRLFLSILQFPPMLIFAIFCDTMNPIISAWRCQSLKSVFKKLIGTKAFYMSVLAIALPVMIQSGITQFVSVLDNLMVGRIGTEQMSGVAISNQLIFIFNLCVFGGLSGIGIFGAQFSGGKDTEGLRYVLRAKLILVTVLTIIGTVALGLFGRSLISLFLHDGSQEGDLVATLRYGSEYTLVMLFGLFPYALSQCFASSLKETGETVLPMIASGSAVLVNLVLNYLLIFGKFGLPVLGVVGAAIATVISRFVELLIILIFMYRRKARFPFLTGVLSSFYIPRELLKGIAVKGTPLLLNETLWSAGISSLSQCYSTRGLAAIAAANISSTASNLFNVVFMAIGSSIGIIIGNLLGAGKFEEAKDTDNKIIALSVSGCFVLGTLLFLLSNAIPQLYETSDEVKSIASAFLKICAVSMPLNAFTHACYFTLRSGGQTKITMLFDSCYVWIICLPTAFILANFTSISIVPMFAICTFLEIIKCAIGFSFVKSNKWLRNIVD